ncbi:Uma2 family endonuclease [Spirosoma aerolatum]|uniref:Uma2 family endonuclease n=1 Tax=Spirosoma aerolatum TaxID=1211326 RepID=UPI00373FE3C4
MPKLYTFDEYVALERSEGIRYEYWDGEVIAMAGTTKRHNTIVQNIRLPSLCRKCTSEIENRATVRLP